MLNLFIIAHDFSGAQTYFKELSAYFKGKDDVFVFQIYLNYEGINEMKVEINEKVTFIYLPKMKRFMSNEKYNKRLAQIVYSNYNYLSNVIIHANNPLHFYFAKEALILFQCPLVFTLHFLENYYSYFYKINKYKRKFSIVGNELLNAILKISDHIICVTRFGFITIKELYGIENQKLSLIYNGIRLLENSSQDAIKLKLEYGFSSKDVLILFVGQLEQRKGIQYLMESFFLIKDRIPMAKLIIAGEGDFNLYMPLAKGCMGRVYFPGKLDKKTLTDLYRISDIGVIPSQFEQCSYVAIEMMQHELPLIISDVPGLNELINDGETGLICSTNPNSSMATSLEVNVEELALKMESLILNRNYANTLAEVARREMNIRHSLETMGDKTYEIYKGLDLKLCT